MWVESVLGGGGGKRWGVGRKEEGKKREGEMKEEQGKEEGRRSFDRNDCVTISKLDLDPGTQFPKKKKTLCFQCFVSSSTISLGCGPILGGKRLAQARLG